MRRISRGYLGLLTEDAAWLPQARDMPGAGEYRGRNVIVDDFLRPTFAACSRPAVPPIASCPWLQTVRWSWLKPMALDILQDGRPYDNRYAWAFELRGEQPSVLREYLDPYYIVRLFGMT